MLRVAVVGGGLAGLTCAHNLQSNGVATHVFDMGTRGPGQRLARHHTCSATCVCSALLATLTSLLLQHLHPVYLHWLVHTEK